MMRWWLAILCLGVLGAAVLAGQPPRPEGDEDNNFYLLAGIANLDYRFDPRGADAFAAAGLDISEVDGQGFIGVGWVLASPVRVDLLAGGGTAEVPREGVDCGLGRAAAELHLALLETSWVALEASTLVGFHALILDGLEEDEAIAGIEVGLGGTARLPLVEPLSLMVSYHWSQARFERANIKLPDDEELRIHPTASFHGYRILLTIDL